MPEEKRPRYPRGTRSAASNGEPSPEQNEPGSEADSEERPNGDAADSATRPRKEDERTEEREVAPATERPVFAAPAPRTSEYVVTVDNQTRLAIKIEKVDPKTGKRRELSKDEYAGIYPAGRPPGAARSAETNRPARAAAFSTTTPTPAEYTALVEAYYRGVADYIKAITST